MSGQNPGTFYIVNSELSPFNNQLATNNIGPNTPLVVSTKSSSFISQHWKVTGEPGSPQRIVPASDLSFEAAGAGNFVQPLEAGAYTWLITKSGDGNFIANPSTGYVWSLNKAAEGQTILLEPKSTPVSQLQVWKFIPA